MKRAFVWLLTLSLLPLLTAFRWPWQVAGDPERIELSGTVEAREVDLAFQVGGRIAELAVDEGDAVQAKQRVATLDARDYELALRADAAEPAPGGGSEPGSDHPGDRRGEHSLNANTVFPSRARAGSAARTHSGGARAAPLTNGNHGAEK